MKLTENHLDRFSQINGVQDIAPVVSGRVNVKNGNQSIQVSLTGVTASYQTVRDTQPAQGRFITDMDHEYLLEQNLPLGNTYK
ncbi:ABC-type lipoprotein release transport system permease subunit [Caldalkalibacillus uzonensis]|uniref:ABC-type lipoprotein release transport system permease subunit n=1 Tax=Caldalkalibacillus uzonensis TaxID=353224 RepID=A0ABU0CNQ9_9BACI|nr:ABC-type lipoprotein release transport system permease subunit [Caldalkalibacillus uzonensis]